MLQRTFSSNCFGQTTLYRRLQQFYNKYSIRDFSSNNQTPFLNSQKASRLDYAKVTEHDLEFFKSTLGDNNVKTEEIDEYNTDFMRWYKGNSTCMLSPSSSKEVSSILRYCYQRNLAVVPQAGNTGLVGGSVPVHDEIILSTRKLTNNFVFDSTSGILECEAGFVLEEVDNRIAAHGYMVPIDLGSKGSCLIGGIVATNAGGIRLIRYGSMHAHVTGLEVVLPDCDGTILKLGSNLRKDNTELHLHKLFIGSEGQLGVITSVNMQVIPRPTSVHSAFICVDTFSNCLQMLQLAKQMLNEILSSFEFIDADAMQMVAENSGLSNPLSMQSNFYLLIETSGSDTEHDSAKMDRFLAHAIDNGLVKDGLFAKSASEANYLWKIRENCSLALRMDGYVFKFDLSLPLVHFYDLTEVVKKRLGHKAKRVVTFGHMGDGNTHLNITTPVFSQEVNDLIHPFINDWVVSKGGSISAEHGIGQLKRIYHHKLINSYRRGVSSKIKNLFDPHRILSPYKMID